MKRFILIAVAIFATMTASAQNIAAVSPENETTIYQTLDDAVTKAKDGSIIYLPGGGFQIQDATKITKKLTIMGVSHRGDTDNADGATVIAGNLNFEGGSDGSSVIGAFVSGNINVGTSEEPATNITIRFCNVGSIQVKNSASSGMVVNQCYLRGNSSFYSTNVRLENNIIHSAWSISGGTINHNVITSGKFVDYLYGRDGGGDCSLYNVVNSIVTNNFFTGKTLAHKGDNCSVLNNCIAAGRTEIGEDCVVLDENTTWDDVFVANKGVQINSNYHLKEGMNENKFMGTDRTVIGIYGGSGFKDGADAHAPIPRIISKKVDEQTDGSGKLHIEVTIKAQ